MNNRTSWRITLSVFINNQGQSSTLKVSYIFKVFGTQSGLMVAQQFDQVTYVCEEHRNFQDSKSILMINDFKILPIILLRQLNFDILSVYQLLYIYYKGKSPLFFNLLFLLLLSEKSLGPESCLAICRLVINRLFIKK